MKSGFLDPGRGGRNQKKKEQKRVDVNGQDVVEGVSVVSEAPTPSVNMEEVVTHVVVDDHGAYVLGDTLNPREGAVNDHRVDVVDDHGAYVLGDALNPRKGVVYDHRVDVVDDHGTHVVENLDATVQIEVGVDVTGSTSDPITTTAVGPHTTTPVHSGIPNVLNMGPILYINVVSNEPVMNEVPSSYANKLSLTSLTKANL
ncbi:hypothetical protein Tco_0028504 [Tanacetum coccineum]